MKVFFLFISLAFSLNANAAFLKNTLKNHASPYLALHGSDPVAWQEWNKQTVARAKKEGKLIYVSSGYFSCHWCHVMQRESYKNKEISEILNEYFIPVKVDREINSALDSRLIDFVERTQGRAGWPLNVFITPEGYPLVGMTYVPTKNFNDILENLKRRWKLEKSSLNEIAKSATYELLSDTVKPTEKISNELVNKYINSFLLQANSLADDMSGGFGEQNKFPSYPQLNLMLSAYENYPSKELKSFLILTLTKMASQGLYDQLGGGFFRYTIDPLWQVPHFEKMLYDNALLASLYIDAAKIFDNKKFEKVAKDTLSFMLSAFRSKKGAYIASLSALDDKGIEGGYYLWQRDELKKILSQQEMKVVELIWKLEGPVELEAGHHLVEVMTTTAAAEILKKPLAKVEEHFNLAKKKMLVLRSKRNVPRDTKLLGAWNGLAMSAFAKAAKEYNDEEYVNAAKDIRDYIYSNLWVKNRLVRAVKNNKILGDASLEDYAYVAQGLFHWFEISKNKKDQKWLEEIILQAWKRFHNDKGWQLAENSLLKYGQSEAVISDGVLPSSSAVLISISLRLADKNKDEKLNKLSLDALNEGQDDITSQPFWYASQVKTLFEYQNNIN